LPYYDLNQLGSEEFEHLCQSLIKKVIGLGTITFGDGPDGGREATFEGRAPYPSPTEQWSGAWIFQAKFHNVHRIGPERARAEVVSDLAAELEKVTRNRPHRFNNYILVTNVPLSSSLKTGTHDKITETVIPKYRDKIRNIHVWGADEVFRFLDLFPMVREAYLQLMTPGDLIRSLTSGSPQVTRLEEIVSLYASTSLLRDRFLRLDQAGDVDEERINVKSLFVDLRVGLDPSQVKRSRNHDSGTPDWMIAARDSLITKDSPDASALSLLLTWQCPRVVLIAGPGEGKSTVTQYLAQIHRAGLLNRLNDVAPDLASSTSILPRVPFRITLKDYAQWVEDRLASDTTSDHNVERYLRDQVSEHSGREVSEEDIQNIFRSNPTLLILDGLDEVIQPDARRRLLDRIDEFLSRLEDVFDADMQVVATSRPAGYSGQFDEKRFLHVRIARLSPDKVIEYTNKWIDAKGLEPDRSIRLQRTMEQCLEDAQLRLLTVTPLQVTILILIILAGGTPPRQREALFAEYLEIIYRRERAKARDIVQTDKQLLFGLHQYVGYLLHMRASGTANVRSLLPKDDFVEAVKSYLRWADPYTPRDELQLQVERLVREARERLVLIVEPEPDQFGFELRSLQEFFAAGHLLDTASSSEQRYSRFESIAVSSHWRNVALFFTGRVGRLSPGEAANVVEVCRNVDREGPDRFIGRGRWLALEVAREHALSPNRRLERSLIEYGLGAVARASWRERQTQRMELLESLPRGSDIRDHVLPVLRELSPSIEPRLLGEALDVYARFGGLDDTLRWMFKRLIESRDGTLVRHALRKLVSLRADMELVREAFEAARSVLPPESIVEAVGHVLLTDADFAQRMFEAMEIPSEVVSRLSAMALDLYVLEEESSPQEIKGAAQMGELLVDTEAQQLATIRLLVEYCQMAMEAPELGLSGPVMLRIPDVRACDRLVGLVGTSVKLKWHGEDIKLSEFIPSDRFLPQLNFCASVYRAALESSRGLIPTWMVEGWPGIEPPAGSGFRSLSFYEFTGALAPILMQRVAMSDEFGPVADAQVILGERVAAFVKLGVQGVTARLQGLEGLIRRLSANDQLRLGLLGAWAIADGEVRRSILEILRELQVGDEDGYWPGLVVGISGLLSEALLDPDTVLGVIGRLERLISGSESVTVTEMSLAYEWWLRWSWDRRVVERIRAFAEQLIGSTMDAELRATIALQVLSRLAESGDGWEGVGSETRVQLLALAGSGDQPDPVGWGAGPRQAPFREQAARLSTEWVGDEGPSDLGLARVILTLAPRSGSARLKGTEFSGFSWEQVRVMISSDDAELGVAGALLALPHLSDDGARAEICHQMRNAGHGSRRWEIILSGLSENTMKVDEWIEQLGLLLEDARDLANTVKPMVLGAMNRLAELRPPKLSDMEEQLGLPLS